MEFTDYEGAIVRVITNLCDVTAEEIAGMYKERWAIQSFFRLIKQNLNVPVLFGTTKNTIFSQLFAGVIAYVLLKFLHTEGHKNHTVNAYLSLVSNASLLVLPCQLNGGLVSKKYSNLIRHYIK